MIWTNEYLAKLGVEAAQAVNLHTPFLFHRFYLAITSGVSVYTLPEKVKSIIRITWKGTKLAPLTWEEACIMFPGTFFIDGSTKQETIGTPGFYILHPTNRRDIRIFPTPNETLSDSGGDPNKPLVEEPYCTISCWRYVDLNDSEASLPSYIDQRIRKAYALWKAFQKEGPGQDLKTAAYYESKYKFLLGLFANINNSVFVSKRFALEPSDIGFNRRPPKPSLPSNFERVIYR